MAQGKGIVAATAYVEHVTVNNDLAAELVDAVVSKCFNSSKQATKDAAQELCLMIIGMNNSAEAVTAGLLKGYTNRQPKIVALAAVTTTRVVEAFGTSVVKYKAILKALPGLFAHADAKVRDAGKDLAVELYSWAGGSVEASLKALKPVQLKELKEHWESVEVGSRQPSRLTAKATAALAAAGGGSGGAAAPGEDNGDDGDAEAAEEAEEAEVDTYETATATEVKIPANFESDIVEAKWSVRKEALEDLLKVLDVPKIEQADFGGLVNMLVKVVNKDSNVLNVTFAAKCIRALANGLRKGFGSLGVGALSALLEKFKEKKASVVEALARACDAVVPTVAYEKLADTFVAALKHKNPSVKQECCSVLARAIRATIPPKGFIKATAPLLVEKLAESQAPLREAATQALAAIHAGAGERAVAGFLEKADKARADKVREVSANAGKSSTAPAKAVAARPKTAPARAKASARPKTAGPGKKSSTSKKAATKPKKSTGSGTAGYADSCAAPTSPAMGLEEAASTVEGLFDATKQEELGDPLWKTRLAAAAELEAAISGLDGLGTREAFAHVKVMEARSKIWKDTNFQVMSKLFDIAALVAEKSGAGFPDRAATVAMPGLIAKMSDTKVRPHAMGCLSAFCEAWTVNDVCQLACTAAEAHKTPKVKEETFTWLTQTVREFGLRVAVKPLVMFAKHGLAQANPAVRNAAVEFATVLYQGAGASIKGKFASEKMADTLNDNFAKVDGQKLPAPVRFERADAGSASAGADADADDGAEDAEDSPSNHADEEDEEEDVGPRSELAVPDSTLEKIPDKNWKIRAEGLEEVAGIVARAGAIKPSLGDLLPVLVARLGDTNRNLVITTLNIITSIANAMGAPMKRHFPHVVEGILHALSESKDAVRAAAIGVLDAMHKRTGLAPFAENEKMAKGIVSNKPHQQNELLIWYKAKLVEAPTGIALKSIIKPTIVCLTDRNQGVRQLAHALLEDIIPYVGPTKMRAVASSLKGTQKTAVLEMISASGSSAPAPAVSESSSAPQPKTGASKTVSRKATKSKTKSHGSSSSKSADNDADGPCLLMDERGKARRKKEEKSNKALKWSFTTPREEFVIQLQDQFSKGPAANPELLNMLFHKDFKQHVKALDVLIDSLRGEKAEPTQAEVFASTDILLQWITLRFFDTNPAVLLKSVTFCQELFTQMADEGVELPDTEAGAFIPHLVNMSGTKLESIRGDVHVLFRTICRTYPSSKVFQYCLEGLKSKNSKQRTELVMEITYMIERQGMSVCQSGAAKSMKIIAKQVSDKDNTARSAALDCVVAVWNIIGNDVYKLLGTMDDKSTSLVIERVKRHGKRTNPAADTAAAGPTAKHAISKRRPVSSRGGSPKRPSPVKSNVKQEFALNMEGLNMPHLDVGDLQLAPTDIVFDETPIDISRSPVPIAKREPSLPSFNLSEVGAAAIPSSGGTGNMTVDRMAEKLVDANPLTVIDALKSAEALTRSSPTFMAENANKILSACTTQARLLFSVHLTATDRVALADGVRLCKHLLGFVLQAFRKDDVASAVTPPVMTTMIADLLQHVQNPRVSQLDEGPQITKALNCILLKILQTINQNLAFSSLFTILSDTLNAEDEDGNVNVKHIQLVQRCIWKLVKAIPDNVESISTGELLGNVSSFLAAHPIHHAVDGGEDIPTRTLRTVIQALVKAKGAMIGDEVYVLGPDPYKSPAGIMVMQALAKIGINPGSGAGTPDVRYSPSRPAKSPTAAALPRVPAQIQNVQLSPAEQDMRLVQIFAMITSKEESKHGMKDLSKFMESYPSANVNKFLMTTSPFFQSHIKRSLAELKRVRDTENKPVAKRASPGKKTAAAYLDRLRSMTVNDKENTVSSLSFVDGKPEDSGRSGTPELPSVDHGGPAPTSASPPKAATDQLAALKARLAKFRK